MKDINIKEIKEATLNLYSKSLGDFQVVATIEKVEDYCKNCVPNYFGIDIDNYREIGEMYGGDKAKNVAKRHSCFLRTRYQGGKTEKFPKHEKDIRFCKECSIQTIKGFLKYSDGWKLEQAEKKRVVDGLLNAIEKE